tara:strand:- start:652 stop:1758 length:1107 start_codon:yes stop_codon:yes gene_type:complete
VKKNDEQIGQVELRNVSKSYGSVKALIGANLKVRRDESVAILGPSGSGKSTLLGILAGFIEADGGDVLFGTSLVNTVPTHKRDVGMVFQRYALFPNQTVFENLAFPLMIRKRPEDEIKRQVEKTLDLVGLSQLADRYPGALSGGQAQRVALARSLVFTPRVLLMDEPLGALDRQLRTGLQVEMRRIQQAAGVPSIYVTHDQEEAMHLADRIILIHEGRIVADSSPQELYQYPRSVWSANFLGSACIFRIDETKVQSDKTIVVSGEGASGTATDTYMLGANSTPLGLVLRPEDGRLINGQDVADSGKGVIVEGEVILTTFLGARQSILIRGANGKSLNIEISGRDIAPEIGARVQCFWPTKVAVVAEYE